MSDIGALGILTKINRIYEGTHLGMKQVVSTRARRVEVAPDGRTARAWLFEVTRIGARASCAERLQTFALKGARLVSTGQTDTVVRCPRAS